jgi:hypothetical protein
MQDLECGRQLERPTTNTGNGALRQLSDPAATAPQWFYRIQQW